MKKESDHEKRLFGVERLSIPSTIPSTPSTLHMSRNARVPAQGARQAGSQVIAAKVSVVCDNDSNVEAVASPSEERRKKRTCTALREDHDSWIVVEAIELKNTIRETCAPRM
jgi:hypothetical protein